MRDCSSSRRVLGRSGSVYLAAAAIGGFMLWGGAKASAGLIQEPIGVSGFTGDTIVDSAGLASSTSNQQGTNETGTGAVFKSSTGVIISDMNDPGNGAYAGTGYVHNGETIYQNGWNNNATNFVSGGIPANGSITAASGNVFNFGYNGTTSNLAVNNTDYFTSTAAQTLSLVTPIQAQTLDFLAAGFLPNPVTTHTQFDVTLNFADSTSDTYTVASGSGITTGQLGDLGGTAPANKAYNFSGVLNGNSSLSKWSGYFTESDITLTPADQLETITSITFTPDSLNQSTINGSTQFDPAGIYAVSGNVYSIPEPVSIGSLMAVSGLALLRRRRPTA